jgi:Tfp pilus assembly protein PilV
MSYDDFLEFVSKNPNYTLSEATGAPIKGRPNVAPPRDLPPADPFAAMAARAEARARAAMQRTREAGSATRSFLTEPQKLRNPATGNFYQTKDPVTGRLGPYATGFTPAQQMARIGLPAAGAVGGASYLAMAERNPREAAAREREEAEMQAAAAADQAQYRETPAAAPAPERRSPFDETNIGAPRFAPARAPVPPRRAEVVERPSPVDNVRALFQRYNETGNPADFILADRAMREAEITGTGEPMPKKAEGGAISGMAGAGGDKMHKDAALHKALEIIHALISSR